MQQSTATSASSASVSSGNTGASNDVVHDVVVDVIIPVHNAACTVEEAVASAMHQQQPAVHRYDHHGDATLHISIHVCCFDDGSTDDSWDILCRLQRRYADEDASSTACCIPSRLWIEREPTSRGAGYARNRAVELTKKHIEESRPSNETKHSFLCLLDADDTMHPHRVAEQTAAMLRLSSADQERTLLGCRIQRDPPDSTWHYTHWANTILLHDEQRLLLERYRECTVLQPTWFLTRSRFEALGGYIEEITKDDDVSFQGASVLRLIHPTFDTPATVRLAEDLRFFHSHLHANGRLQLVQGEPLVTYRHQPNDQSQSFRTSRKLLLHLRTLAFERCVLQQGASPWKDGPFVVWGAGRDGKDFIKALSEEARQRIYCCVDVDDKKIQQHCFYDNPQLKLHIPIVHFSLLARTEADRERLLFSGHTTFGRIDKSKPTEPCSHDNNADCTPSPKKQKVAASDARTTVACSPRVAESIDLQLLPQLPVVVLVAMYRTQGALESNVRAIGREEGKDLWHFS